MKTLLGAVAMLCVSTPALSAVEKVGPFIGAPTNVNGFEAIEADPDYIPTVYFPRNTTYLEDGIAIRYVSSATDVDYLWTKYQYNGNDGWYPNGGDIGYTEINMTGFAIIDEIQFSAGTGGFPSDLHYRLYLGDSLVQSGVLGPLFSRTDYAVSPTNQGLATYGFSGGGFNRLQLFSPYDQRAGTDALSLDDIAVVTRGIAGPVPTFPTGVPEPATWAMMITGIGLAGGMLRRRGNVVSGKGKGKAA